jgi:branched-chain amino acid transport system ATP-binding protein
MAQFLEVKQVSKNFGKLAALSDISFSVNQGELVGLIGPNGAGKTTLFNVTGPAPGRFSSKARMSARPLRIDWRRWDWSEPFRFRDPSGS